MVSARDLLREAKDVSFSIEVSSFDSSDIEAFDNVVSEDKSLDKVLFDCENENMAKVGITNKENIIEMIRKPLLVLIMNRSIMCLLQI